MKLIAFLTAIILITGCASLFDQQSGIRVTKTEKNGETNTLFEARQSEGAKEPTSATFNQDGSVTVVFGSQYNADRIKQVFKAFRIYHLAAVICAIIGFLCIKFGWTSTKVGWAIIGFSGSLSAWATIMPQFSGYVFIALIVGCVAGAGYLLWRHGK